MTVIAAVVQDSHIYMGGDSAVTSGHRRSLDPLEKVWMLENHMLIGLAGECRACDVMRYEFVPSEWPFGQDIQHYMRVTFIQALRACLGEHINFQRNNANDHTGITGIIGWKGQLWELDNDFSIVQTAEPYMALGSGGQLALAALHVLPELPPLERLQRAMLAAEHYDITVKGPSRT